MFSSELLGMSFESDFTAALEEMIPKFHDDYTELQYSDEIFVQVWSHDDGAGAFEIYAIVPHDTVPDGVVGRGSGSSLPPEVPGVEQFYTDVEEYIREVTSESFELHFQLMEVVDDGTWERDASVYCTHKLTQTEYDQ